MKITYEKWITVWIKYSYFLSCHNQISLTNKFPDHSLTLGLFPYLSQIPWYFQKFQKSENPDGTTFTAILFLQSTCSPPPSAGCSGQVASTPDCDARGSRIEPTMQTVSFFTNITAIWYAALGMDCTLTEVSCQSELYAWVIKQMAMGEFSAYSSLLADTKVNFADWPTSWRPPSADQLSLRWPEWTPAYGFTP